MHYVVSLEGFGDDFDMPSTLMGQFMEALTSTCPTNLEDLGLNIESFQGGLECNVDEASLIYYFKLYSSAYFA